MLCYRLYEDLPGRGPLGFGYAAGRWNRRGMPLIYMASTGSLAFLELLSIRGSIVLQSSWKLASIRCLSEVPLAPLDVLPPDWSRIPHPGSTWAFGDVWLKEADSPYLKVPSARLPHTIYPKEHNIIMNPLFHDFASFVEVEGVEEVGFLLNG